MLEMLAFILLVCELVICGGAADNASSPSAICFYLESESCFGGNQTLSRISPKVQVNDNTFLELDLLTSNGSCIPLTDSESALELDLEQIEHGGGECNCLRAYFINSTNFTSICADSFINFILCGGSASIPRRAKIMIVDSVCIVDDMLDAKTSIGAIEKKEGIQSSDNVVEISFELTFGNCDNCSTIDSFNEGVELSIQTESSDSWKPLIYLPLNNTQAEYNDEENDICQIDLKLSDNNTIRGYEVDIRYIAVTGVVKVPIHEVDISKMFRFRWLQTSCLRFFNCTRDDEKNDECYYDVADDVWRLDNITVSFFDKNDLLSTCSDSPLESIRNGNNIEPTNTSDSTYFFGGEMIDVNSTMFMVSSRSALSQWYNVLSCPMDRTKTKLLCQNSNTRGSFPGLCSVEIMEERISQLEDIQNNRSIDGIDRARLLSLTLTTRSLNNLPYNQSVLVTILNFAETIKPMSMTVSFSLLFSTSSGQVKVTINNSEDTLNAGVTLFQVLDIVLFNYFPPNQQFIHNYIALFKKQYVIKPNQDSGKINVNLGNRKDITAKIPRELLKEFATDDYLVNVTSSLFGNAESFFSEQLLRNNQSVLASDIVSISLQCKRRRCPTRNLTLTTNVTIEFEHSQEIKNKLQMNNSLQTVCVFLEIQEKKRLSNDSYIYTGNWLTSGCSSIRELSSDSKTVCGCNHLTHFAILLSPKPPTFSKPVQLSLMYIGYIGISISVLAMITTIIIFVSFKSLRTMRNYIHVNLCASLIVAQLLFVAGIDRTGPDGSSSVPVHCQVIAILLHYFFLVTFMWMLMEGVVLYLVLVRVFVHYTKRYTVAFTVVSYGLPLVYIGIIGLPVAYHQSGEYYGTTKVCFLNHENHFIWAFIAPVLLILLANVGFLVMAGVIMCRHQMKQTDRSSLLNTLSWLKGIASLVIVMGITWIIGLLIVSLDILAPLAYIYTILVAFQGLLIFLIFIVFSKVVRDTFKKCWREHIKNSDIWHYYKHRNASKLHSNNVLTKSSKLHVGSSRSLLSTSTERKNSKSISGISNGKLPHHNIFMNSINTDEKEKKDEVPKENNEVEDWPEFEIILDNRTKFIETSTSVPIN